MKLEKQVVSLELAKRLEQLGVKQESAFIWRWDTYSGSEKLYNLAIAYREHDVSKGKGFSIGDDCVRQTVAGFTVAELGEMLRAALSKFGERTVLNISQERIRQLFHRVMNGISENEAEDRAKMLVYLLENKLITL
jgi:hypothetical protein